MAISVEQLSKIYKVNKGEDVCALKNVSFNLPDTGMIFILGKSGCGKSTLLNVLGGLDGFDGGDVKIDGKSIKDYKAKDLDGYRNDYVGFVFQENNLLEKESVRRNVALSLDLQSIKDRDGKITAALESVGLKEFEERKCNRLSGGQKQRVAIARALVKEPKLLLCDEPTGALDSDTGADIFALLKELSSKRLVMVVSHDRESAEKYGDRVIELKDGEVISDSAPLAGDSKSVAPDKPSGDKAKRGGLRFLRAFTMGVGYIISRPVRMAICILLCLLTFTFVGVVDTVNAYNKDEAILNTMEENEYKNYAFGKGAKIDDIFTRLNDPQMSIEEADELASILDVERYDYIYNTVGVWNMNEVECVIVEGQMSNSARLKGYVETDEKFLSDYGYPLLAGKLPENTGEVALPLYIYKYFETYWYSSDSGKVKIKSYDDLIGKAINIKMSYSKDQSAFLTFTVTGIVDTFFDYPKQADVLFNGAPLYGSKSGMDLSLDMINIEMDVIHNTAFVCKGFDAYFSENYIENEEYVANQRIARVIAPFKGSDSQKLKNIRIYNYQSHLKPIFERDNKRCYYVANCATKSISDAERRFSDIQEYSVYIIAAAVTISALFLFYYASGTIIDKRREIGILRALGASRLDILKIIACEHGTFTAVAVAISSVISAVLTIPLNISFTKDLGFSTTLIRFGMRQFAVVAAIAILAVAVGVAFPLIKLLRSKPVDVIADRK